MSELRETIAKNILYYRKKAKLSQKEVAEQLGVSIPAVSKWENGTNSIGIEILFDLCQLLGVPVNKIYGVDGEVEQNDILEKYNALDEHGRKLVDAVLGLEYERLEVQEVYKEQSAGRDIPIYQSKAAAGTPLPIVTDAYDMCKANAPAGTDYGIKLSGDSMEPEYPDGCTVWVKAGTDMESGDIGVFSIAGEAICKKIYWDENGCRLESLNPKYAPIEITAATNLYTHGKVVGHTV